MTIQNLVYSLLCTQCNNSIPFRKKTTVDVRTCQHWLEKFPR